MTSSFSNSIEKEYQNIDEAGRSGWHKTYQDIREKCDREANQKDFNTGESERPQNRGLNRYRDVNPYDHSRIILHRGGVDYINANLVKLERAERKYILTQGPLSDTVGHFWLMVWEQNTKAILMLNKLMEKKQIKCHLYWPERKGPENALKLEEVNLKVEFQKSEQFKDYIRRWFKLTDLETNQSREIIQFHYTTWPDFGIPSSPVAFLYFLKQVRDSGALDTEVGPAVVHCSAGIGRSGTFCLVDCCLVLIDKEGEKNVSVQDILCELRRYRMGLIQTADQLYFSYQAIIKGIQLLKNAEFLNHVELPVENDDQHNLEETPPPLPPRSHSLLPLAGSAGGILTLNLGETHSKPLPTPAIESYNDGIFVNTNSKDALNNFINSEKSAEHMPDRPLPAPPQQHCGRMHDSESDDESEIYENDSENDALLEEDTENDNENDKIIPDAKRLNDNNDNDAKEHKDEQNANNMLNISKTYNKANEGDDSNKWNGIDANNKSREAELRRRKRAERQADMESKINEIKRKQREVEANQNEAKKRRSLIAYITAGVVVGVICVYAYSKLS